MIDLNKTSKSSANEILDALEEQGFDVSPPVNVDKIAEHLGIKVAYKLVLDGSVGSISFENDVALVTINRIENTYEPRRRFTLAHEIAHYCLHKEADRNEFVDTRKTMSRKGSYWDIYESEANSFAAELLMPKKELIKHGREIIETYLKKNTVEKMPVKEFVSEMAKLFEVSNPAMEYRLKNLGIVKE